MSLRTYRYLTGVAAAHGSRLLAVATGFWLTPFVLETLGRESYGVAALAAGVTAWLTKADLGLAPGLQAHLARLPGCAAPARRCFRPVLGLQVGLAAIVFVAGWALAPRLAGILGITGNDAAVALLRWLSAAAAITLISKVLAAVLNARQRVARVQIAQAAQALIRAVVTVVLLLRGWGLAALGAAQVAGAGTAVLFHGRCIRFGKEEGDAFSWSALREMASTGLWFTLGGLAGLLILGIDRVVAAHFVSVEAVTVLVLTSRVYALAQDLLAPLVETARPALGELLGAGRNKAAAHAHHRLLYVVAGSAFVAAVSLWAGNAAFVAAWVGPAQYGGAALDAAFASSFVLGLVVLPHRALLASALLVRPATLCRLAEAAVNLPLSLLLTWRFGLVGVALSTTLAALLTSCWYLPRLVSSGIGFTQVRAKGTGFSGIVSLVGTIVLAWFARETAIAHGGYAAAVLAAILTAAAGSAAVWFGVFDAALRLGVRDAIGGGLLPRSCRLPVTAGASVALIR